MRPLNSVSPAVSGRFDRGCGHGAGSLLFKPCIAPCFLTVPQRSRSVGGVPTVARPPDECRQPCRGTRLWSDRHQPAMPRFQTGRPGAEQAASHLAAPRLPVRDLEVEHSEHLEDSRSNSRGNARPSRTCTVTAGSIPYRSTSQPACELRRCCRVGSVGNPDGRAPAVPSVCAVGLVLQGRSPECCSVCRRAAGGCGVASSVRSGLRAISMMTEAAYQVTDAFSSPRSATG